ncbi:hypothetical protein [Flaviaesturariibacter amylovorans]|uniref:Lipoprotein n=1 Tax=Flaviaesturariibacter amylovorans TaxID=1084520 RepID=A0ABP8HAE0_9BACT
MRTLLLIWLLATGCAGHRGGFHQRKFLRDVNGQEIRMRVPAGYLRELLYQESSGGFTQFYTYRNGSVFYVSWKVPMPDFNAANIRRAYPDSAAAAKLDILQGIDASSLYWKQSHADDLKVGYLNVPKVYRNDFGAALQSVRVRKRPFVQFLPAN